MTLPKIIKWCVTRLIHTDQPGASEFVDFSWIHPNGILEGPAAESARAYLMRREALTWIPASTHYMTWRMEKRESKVILLAAGPMAFADGLNLSRFNGPPLLLGPPGPYRTLSESIPNADSAYFLLERRLTLDEKERVARIYRVKVEQIDDAGMIVR